MATEGDDTIHGGWFDDDISGLGGNDDIFGKEGDDTLRGGSGSDFLKAGTGNDSLLGGANNDVLVSGEREPVPADGPIGIDGYHDVPNGGNDSLFGGTGNDVLIVTMDKGSVLADGGSDVDTIQIAFDDDAFKEFLDVQVPALVLDPDYYDAEVDLAAGTGAYRFNGTTVNVLITVTEVENITGSSANETLSGDAGGNVIRGGRGNDALQGRGGADTLDGGSGRDRAIYDLSSAVDIDLTWTTQLGGDAHGDRLISVEDIDGSRNSDSIRGNSAANNLFGNLGNDTLEGRGGADTLNGAGNVDTAAYGSSASGVTVRLDTGEGFGGDAEGDRLISIENLTGSSFADILVGSSGSNVLRGANGNDQLSGLDGNDTLDGGFGSDTLDGGAGVDTASLAGASAGLQVTLRSNGLDGRAVHGNYAETDVLRGIENVTGSAFNDSFYGNDLANTFDGGAGTGADYFFESRGDDRYLGGDGLDALDMSGDAVGAVVNLSTGTLTRATSAERDIVSSIERVVGTSGDDSILGRSVAETLIGGAGDDTIAGFLGRDELTGGAGSDVYLFRSESDSPFNGDVTAIDDVNGFDDGDLGYHDLIDLSGIDADGLLSNGDNAFIFVEGEVFGGNRGEMVISGFIENGVRIRTVAADIDGDRLVDFALALRVSAAVTFDASDFVL